MNKFLLIIFLSILSTSVFACGGSDKSVDTTTSTTTTDSTSSSEDG